MSLSLFELIVLVAVSCLALGSGATWLYMRIQQLQARIQTLEAEAVQKVEPPATRKRMPYEAAEEVIDAVAVLDAMREKRMLEVEHYDNVKAHLVKALESGAKRATMPGRTPGTDARVAPTERDESEL